VAPDITAGMALRVSLCGFIEPCLPSPAERPPSGPGWVHEIKHDGFRMMVRRDPAGVRLLTDAVEKVGSTASARNNRIPGDHFLNRPCAISGRLESMLLRDPPQNRFSTASTRNGHDWSARYPQISEAADALQVRSFLIDGEAVA
jgi:ATP-dependent DNA ligase